MSIPIKLDQEVELRDSAGKTVAYVVPASLLKELREELDRLRKELENVCTKRDEYRDGLICMMKDYITFTPEELADAEKNGLSFDQLMAEIQPILQGTGHGK